MRQRTTFIHEPQDAIDPKSFELFDDPILGPSLTLKGIKAAREDRIVFAYNELPQHIRVLFERTDKTHLKHVQPDSSKSIPPFNAKVGAGLHVSFEDVEQASSELSKWVTEEFSLKSGDACGPMNAYTFSSNGTGPRQHSKVEQTAYYVPQSQLPGKENFIATEGGNNWGNLFDEHSSITKGWSKARLDELREATYIDIDYDINLGLRRFLGLSAYWSPRVWESTTIQNLVPTQGFGERIEVGVLSNETPERPEEVKLAGYLMVLGETEEPKATMFSFPSKHHSHDAAYSAMWIEPTGLHPNLGLKIDHSIPPKSGEECKLYAHLTLPRTVFADRYQFSDSLFLASKNLANLTWISSPVDLEAPEYAQTARVSSLLLELAPPAEPKNESWTAEIPLHLRYLKPSKSGYREAEIPTPMLFWGCKAELEGTSPFDRQGVMVEKLLPEKNVFYHLEAEGNGYQTISAPVLSTKHERYIEVATTSVILLGFGWVMWKSLQVLLKVGYGSGAEKVKVETKKE